MPGSDAGRICSRLRLTVDRGVVDVLVDARASATVGEVEDALRTFCHAQGSLVLEGQGLPRQASWSDVMPVDGSGLSLTVATVAPRESLHPTRFELDVIAGPLSGARFPLRDGTHLVGRGSTVGVRLADPTVSSEHLRVVIAPSAAPVVRDVSSRNHTLLDGAYLTSETEIHDESLLSVGRSLLGIRRRPPTMPRGVRVDGGTRRLVQRPPRAVPPEPATREFVVPEPPGRQRAMRLPWVAMLLPLVAVALLVAFTKRPAYLVFGLLSPLLMLGTFLSERRARRQDHAAAHREFDARRAQHLLAVNEALATERLARHAAHPDLALVHAAATGPTALLWHRDRADSDALTVRVGTSALPSFVLEREAGGRPQALEVDGVPVAIDLAEAGVLGLSGERSTRDAILRSILLQLCTFRAPSDVHVAFLASPASMLAHWDWAKWLPHLAPDAATDSPDHTVDRVLADAAQGVTQVVVAELDENAGPAVARLLSDGPALGVVVLALAKRFTALPRACRETVDIERSVRPDPAGTLATLVRADGTRLTLRPDELAAPLAEEMARSLAGCADRDLPAERHSAGGPLPDSIGFLDSLGRPDLSTDGVLARWLSPAGSVPIASCGVGVNGPVLVDLRSGHSGPNAFLAGTVGSGKSDFLRSFLASLALANSPDALNLILIDFKEGSGLEVLAQLPHVADMVTNAERAQLPRILTALGAERQHRQEQLKRAGFDSFDDFQASPRPSPIVMPRLFVVVDEFAALRASVPDAMDRLVDIVRRGRSAGMHLILSTQTVSTSVGQDIVDNTTLHVSLRVESESESRALVGTHDAARIPARLRGRGLMSDGRPAQVFQAGWLGARSENPADLPAVQIRQFGFGRGQTADDVDAATSSGTPPLPTDAERVFRSLRSAALAGGLAAARPPWAPPLPTLLTLDGLGPAPVDGLALPLGLEDVPTARAQGPWLFDLQTSGHLVAVGGSRSGRTSLLRTVAGSAVRHGPPGTVAVYAIEGSGRALTGLTALPQVRAVVGADDPERLNRLLRLLTTEVATRQRLLAQRHSADLGELPDQERPPRFLVLIDAFEALHDDALDGEESEVLSAITSLLRDGPAVGVHLVVTTDASKVHTRAISSVGTRLVLALPEATQYVASGVSRDCVPLGDLPPGRGVLAASGHEVQVALMSRDTSAAAQNRAIADLARSHSTAVAAFTVPEWPDRVVPADCHVPGIPSGRIVLGVHGDDLTPFVLDLSSLAPGLLILGPRQSGRSTTLALLAHQASGSDRPGPPVVLVTPRGAERDRALWDGIPVAAWAEGPGALQKAQASLQERDQPSLVLVDDADRFLDGPDAAAFDAFVASAADAGHVLAVAGSFSDIAGQMRSWTTKLRRGRSVLLLRPPGRAEIQLLGLPALPRTAEPRPHPGRGVLFLDGAVHRVQVAVPPH